MRIFAGLLVLVVMLTLVGCASTTTTTTPPKGDLVPIANVETDPAQEPQGWQEWGSEIIAPNGNIFELPEYGWVIAEYEDRCLMLLANRRELWLCDQETGFTKLSGDQLVIDYTVAYDTVYWFNLEREVWAVDWYTSTEARLFCEDAVAVSPHTDEAEGAVVTWDRANIDYGYGLPIYSPYGE